MTTIADVQAAVNGTSVSKTSANSTQGTEDRFLKLLVTQMQNQDPLNPLDNAQVTSQMAQLSTVTGIEKLNTALSDMSKSFMANQSLQAANMIGHNVLAPGGDLNLKGGTVIAGIELQGAADKVAVSIKDSKGNVVRNIDMGEQKAGTVSFQWDGKTEGGQAAPDGKYTFEVVATQGTESVTADKLTLSKVTSVTLGAQGVSLNVEGQTKPIDAVDVKQIY